MSDGDGGGYHSSKHDPDNVQHFNPGCAAATSIHKRCSCTERPRSCRVCGVRRAASRDSQDGRLEALYDECAKVARRGDTTYYSAIAPFASLDMSSEADRISISDYLNQISRREYLDGRPLLSAVVTRKGENRPGKGFFDLARELGLHNKRSDDRYWARELGRVHQHWRDA